MRQWTFCKCTRSAGKYRYCTRCGFWIAARMPLGLTRTERLLRDEAAERAAAAPKLNEWGREVPC